MGLQSALTTSLTGLQAAETTISVVGNNVANSNTVGFKESDTVFSTQFLQTISIGSAPNTNSGGSNPQQIGLGVRVSQIAPNFTQGTIEISSNPLDVAIQGDGFLTVQGLQGEELYTRNGQLSLNSLNELTTINGQRVLGFGVNEDFELQTANRIPLTIPLGEQQVAAATTTARLSGTLNPAVDLGSRPSVSESAVFSDGQISTPDINNFESATDLFVATAPNAGTAATAAGSSGPGAGDVLYRVAFVDSDGNESTFSPTFTVAGHTANQPIDISNLPTDFGDNFVDRVIYRTAAGGSDFFRVGTLSELIVPTPGDPTAVSAFTDTLSDTDLLDTNRDGSVSGQGAFSAFDDSTVEQGVFNYFVTYFNVNTGVETAPVALGQRSVTESGGSRVRLDLSSLGAGDNGFSQLRIYRNLSGSQTDFRRIASGLAAPTVGPPATNAAAFIDSTPSNALTATSAETLNFDGPQPAGSTPLRDLLIRGGGTSTTFTNVFSSTGTLTFDANVAGIDIEQQSFAVGDDTTVEDLAFFIEDALGIATSSSSPGEPFPGLGEGGSVTFVNGQFVVTSNLGEQNAIDIPLAAFNFIPTGQAAAQPLDIQFSETQQANGPGTSTELQVFDSLGLPISVRITTVLEDNTSGNSTVYRWFATSGDNEPNAGSTTVVGDGVLTFDSNGDLLPGSSDRIAIQRTDTASASPLEVELDFSGVSSLGTTDAQGELTSSLSFTSQDGFPPGVLTDFIITDDGTIQGQFSNGVQRSLGQIVLARFINNQGLQQVGDNLYAQSVNSGEPIRGVPGEGGIGTLSAGAVELSNTDIGQNLIELILASTQYRGGARVITATQELLDELLALQR